MEKVDVEITVELNSKDRAKAMIYNIFFRRKWVAFYVGIFVAFSLFALAAKAFNIYDIPLPIILCAGGLILLLALFIASVILTSQGAATKRWVRFTETTFFTSAGRDNKRLSFSWKDLYFTGGTKNYFYIYIDASQFIVVPKRYLAREQVKALKDLI